METKQSIVAAIRAFLAEWDMPDSPEGVHVAVEKLREIAEAGQEEPKT